MSSWNFPNMLNTILVGPASLCVSIFKVGLRELSALDKLLQIFWKTLPRSWTHLCSCGRSPPPCPRCGSSSSSRIGGSRAADYLGCCTPESLLPAFQQLLPARESRRATRQRPSPLPHLPFHQSHQISTFLNRGISPPHPLQLVSRSFSNSHSFGLDPHNQMGTRPPPT